MLNGKCNKVRRHQCVAALLFGAVFGGIDAQPARAQNLDAGFVLNKMTSDQQVSYVAGVVEGLAFSRWQRDKPDSSGLRCIHAWYGKKDKWSKIEQWFGRHPNKQPGALLYILIKQDCGA